MNKEKTIIDSTSTTFVSLKEIIKYKSLLNNLARRDFLVRYKQALAGVLWAIIKPLINIIVFGFIASKINSNSDIATNFVFVASAMLLWQLFANVFNDVSNSIIGNSNLFSKEPRSFFIENLILKPPIMKIRPPICTKMVQMGGLLLCV